MIETLQIDLNCDMGESFGTYQLGNDEAILDWVTSANIACGFHAGDPLVMQHTVALASQKGVAIGAHPGLPDLVGFGRRNMQVSPDEVYAMVAYQIGALQAFLKIKGADLHHVKPHGALYNMAATNKALANAIAEAILHVSPKAILYGLAGSELIKAGEAIGLKVANEVFADRTYQPDGTLTPRSMQGALLTDQGAAVRQVLQMVESNTVAALDGSLVPIKADTVCIHGDGPHALVFAKSLAEHLSQKGIHIKAFR